MKGPTPAILVGQRPADLVLAPADLIQRETPW